jgi:hypothetical protein
MHPLAWIMEICCLVAATVIWFAVSLLVIRFLSWKRLSANQKEYGTIMLALVLSAGFVGVFVPSPSFEAGRERGYARLDTRRIAEACKLLQEARKNQVDPDKGLLIDALYGDISLLPPYLQEIKPAYVAVVGKGVTIRMDGGGAVCNAEGLFVPYMRPGEDATTYAISHGLDVLNADDCVFIYRVDDDSMLFDD